MNLLNIILMMGQGEEGGGIGSFLPLILIVLVFYLFFIRPQMKKSKDQKRFRESIGKGDKIITIGGIHGKILEVKETTVVIEIDGQNRLTIEKSALAMDRTSHLSEKK
ncbi:MAG: preprotein translocase subunit YajC [Deltaproteobacteria bacterium]|nr:preprotein translocase subunit YajC [Deltaproteobacteria bacterium]